MSKRAKIYKVEGAKETIGATLKEKRIELGYSLGDAADMTDFSKSTISNLESGTATNLDYYITYAQAIKVHLPILFDIPIEYKPRQELSADKQNRIFLSRKIRVLFYEEDFFRNNVTVNDIISRLVKKVEVGKNDKLSTNVSRVLLNWVEDGLIQLVEKRGRNNVYAKSDKISRGF